MGIYLNPGNFDFSEVLSGNYVDKTGLIEYINSTLGKRTGKLTCVSRPRRFGKTLAAQMLCAYYDKSCDSKRLFDGLAISRAASYETHLNKYNVIYLDITWFVSRAEQVENVVSDIQECVIRELKQSFPECIGDEVCFLADALGAIFEKRGERFFFVIDEWDALFRETKDNLSLQKTYIQFLRGMFKGPMTGKTVVGAYMTGILPIKKYGTESALTDFMEYTMIEPDMLAEYVGFTEAEVKALCEEHHIDFELMKQWYDGYSLGEVHSVYSPNSVMSAIHRRRFGSYWTQTESYESLKGYISMNMGGLKDSIVTMLGGQRVQINPLSFQNDLISMDTSDKVLTLLVHLGYLAFDSERREVYIPNLEVAEVFKLAVEDTGWHAIGEALEKSARLLEETLAGNSEYVARALVPAHESVASILEYNDENSLACALMIAYYTAQSDYTIVRELPSGKGFVDFAFIPCRHSDKPPMIVELKYNKSAETAIQQIKEKRYVGKLKEFGEKILLIGINYDKESKEYSCFIETML